MPGAKPRPRRPRVTVVVESDLPPINELLPWERELLLPVVQQLVQEALADAGEEEQAAENHDEPRPKQEV